MANHRSSQIQIPVWNLAAYQNALARNAQNLVPNRPPRIIRQESGLYDHLNQESRNKCK